jgi:protein gp37
MGTKIEWTQETWNPTIGCSKISEGCKNCYAEKFAYRLSHNPKTMKYYVNVIDLVTKQWSNKIVLIESVLRKPFYLKKPRMIFICSMGDLFHEFVDFEFIDRVMTVIALNPQHIFQILTKRPERMAEYFEKRKYLDDLMNEIAYDFKELDYNNLPKNWINDTTYVEDMYGDVISENELRYDGELPLENLWLGVTAENQEMADQRIPILLQIPSKVHFVSFEPLLSNINLLQSCQIKFINWIKNNVTQYGLDWIIAGQETGHGKRPTLKKWIESLYEQCKSANIPFFDKKNVLSKNIQQYPI